MVDIVRWDPFRDLMSIHDELNRLFGRTFGAFEPTRPPTTGGWMPALDLYETDQKIVATLELPGIEPTDVDISVEDSVLTVEGKRELSSENKEDNYHRIERRYGSFSRSIRLPSTADTEKVEASFDRGILVVEVPEIDKAKPKRVQVKAKA